MVDLEKPPPRKHRALVLPDLRPYVRAGGLARAWAAGSMVLLRRVRARCAAGENRSERAGHWGTAAFAAACAAEACVMYPGTAPCLLLGAWSVAAWAVAPPLPETPAKTPPDEAEDTPEEDPAEPSEEQMLRALIEELIGDDNGVHLQDLYPAMRTRLPGLAQAPDETLRQVLAKHHIKVRRSFRARGVPGRSGVHRQDLPSPTGPRPLSTPLSASGDAGQRPSGEQPESQRRAPGDPFSNGVTITADTPINYHRVTR